VEAFYRELDRRWKLLSQKNLGHAEKITEMIAFKDTAYAKILGMRVWNGKFFNFRVHSCHYRIDQKTENFTHFVVSHLAVPPQYQDDPASAPPPGSTDRSHAGYKPAFSSRTFESKNEDKEPSPEISAPVVKKVQVGTSFSKVVKMSREQSKTPVSTKVSVEKKKTNPAAFANVAPQSTRPPKKGNIDQITAALAPPSVPKTGKL
jgi:hypothetical protein